MHRSIFFRGFGIALACIAGLAASAASASARIADFAIALVREGFPPPDPRASLDRHLIPQARQVIGLDEVRAFIARRLARANDSRPRRDLTGLPLFAAWG